MFMKITLVIILISFLVNNLYCQKLFNAENKLSNSFVNQVIQSNKGYIWFATENGLNCFDGETTKIYQSQSDKCQLNSNNIKRIFEDKKGRLWVGSSNGLQLYKANVDNFVDVHFINGLDTITIADITDIAEDLYGNVYISTLNRGLYCYDEKLNLSVCRYEGIAEIDSISSIAFDKQNTLWIQTNQNKLYRCNPSKGEITLNSNIKASKLYSFGNNVYTYTDNNICMLDNSTSELKKCNLNIDNEQLTISTIYVKGDNIYIGTEKNGLLLYNTITNELKPIDIFVSQFDIKKSTIKSILIDKADNIWLNIYQIGVVFIPHYISAFNNYGYFPNEYNNINQNNVTSLLCDDKYLWIGTYNDGIYKVNANGIVEQHITANIPNNVLAILTKDENHKWIGGDEGLFLLDTRNNVSICQNNKMPLQKSYHITALTNDNQGKLWVGTNDAGAFRLDANNDISFPLNNNRDCGFEFSQVNCLQADSDLIRIGTNNGMLTYDIINDSFIIQDKELLENIEGRAVNSIYKDIYQKLWIATNKGIVVYNEATKEIDKYTTLNGLTSDMAVGIIGDEFGNIWISTNNGVSIFDTETVTFNSYYTYNGLQGNQYNINAIAKAKEGNLYFGCSNGVTGVNTKKIELDKNVNDVELIRLYINGKEIRHGEAIDGYTITDTTLIDARELIFSGNIRNATFEVSNFDYINSDKINYEYKISELDTLWYSAKSNFIEIDLTNIRKGNYTLCFRAKSGQYMSDIKSITFEVMPTWWQTMPAYLLYLIILAVIILLIIKSAKSRQRIILQLQQQERNREIDEEKIKLFFNISNEIRTPLTLIINPIKELLNADSQNASTYNIIYRNAVRLLRLTSQMLDIHKIEKEQMNMQYNRVDIIKYIKDILYTYKYLTDKKQIITPINSLLVDNMVDIDIYNFDKVLNNIYSNAYKYTPDKGEIITTIKEVNDRIIIEIADNGIGIEEASIERIFDRFYQISDNSNNIKTGIGIGLHLAKSIVELHGGTIKAANRFESRGAVFTIDIPRHHETTISTENEVENINKEYEILKTGLLPNIQKNKTATNYRILIVDSEQEEGSFVALGLSKTYKTEICNNGKEAYELLLRQKFDAVISDEQNGVELCQKIKNNININHIPIILITSKKSTEDYNEILTYGVDSYIEKPFDITILQNTLNSIISNRERIITKFTQKQNKVKKSNVKSSDEILIEKVNQYIQKHIADNDLNVGKLAEHIGLSRVHLYRKIKELTGQNAHDYIRNIRLQRAGFLFSQKKLNISEVAYSLGFSNLSHFSNAFKDFYGMSPKEYMNQKLNE